MEPEPGRLEIMKLSLGQTWPIWAESSPRLYDGEPVPASDAETIRAHLFVCEGLYSAHAEG